MSLEMPRSLRLALRALRWAAVPLALAACSGDSTGGGGGTPNPVPALSGVSPEQAVHAGGAFTLTVQGTGFVRGSVVRWVGSDRPTTFVSATQLTASISAADADTYGPQLVTVYNPAPGGGESNGMYVSVEVPVAKLTALVPSTLTVGVGGTVAVKGTGIVAGSWVTVAGVRVPTTVSADTQAVITIAPGQAPVGGDVWVQVVRPDSARSGPLTLTFVNPAPKVTGTSPMHLPVEQDSAVVHLSGSGFVAQTDVRVNGNPKGTRRLGPGDLEIVLSAAELASTGTLAISLANPQPGGGVDTTSVQVENPPPTLTGITPDAAEAGQDSLVVRLSGTGFVKATTVEVDGESHASRRVSATAMDVVLSGAETSGAATVRVAVRNPAPGGGFTAPETLKLVTPVPVLSLLPTTGATAGGGAFVLTVHGDRFVQGSQVLWHGVPQPTTYVSNRRLRAQLATSDLAAPRTVSVSVRSPGGGTSRSVDLSVRSLGAATLTGSLDVPLPARDVAYSERSGRIYASLDSTAGSRANTVVAIDPATGAVTDSVAVGRNPGLLALSDDGGTLWVAVDGTHQLVKLSVPALTVVGAFTPGPDRVVQLQVMPGRPGTVAVQQEGCCGTSGGIAVLYDDGLRRPRTAEGQFFHALAFGEDGAVLYATDTQTSAFAFRTYRVGADGLTEVRVTEGAPLGGSDRMAYAGGRAYGVRGQVVDAERHEVLAPFPDMFGATSLAVDADLGRVFFFNPMGGDALMVLDANTRALLGSFPVSGVTRLPGASTQRLVRCGADRVVLSDGVAIHILRSPLFGP